MGILVLLAVAFGFMIIINEKDIANQTVNLIKTQQDVAIECVKAGKEFKADSVTKFTCLDKEKK